MSDLVDLSWSEGEAAALELLEKLLPAQVTDGAVLEATDVAVAFGGVKALRGVSIRIPARTFVGLIGPNGSGKTTLFDVMSGFTVPDSGRVEAFGRDISRLHAWDRARLGIGRTFQANHISPDETVRDNLLTGAYLKVRGGLITSVLQFPGVRADRYRAERTTVAVARLLGLEDVLDVRAGALSFGGQRRTEIARCLMGGPRLLLLDEPSAGMDAHEAQQLVALVKRLHVDLGLAVCLIEHFIRMVFDNCDIVQVIARGELVALGSPAEVAANPRVQATYLGTSREEN